MGWVLRDQGKSEAAETLFRRALEGHQRAAGRDSPRSIKAMTELAMALIDRKSLDEASSLLERAVEIGKRTLGERHPDYLYTLNTRGWLLYTQEK